MTDKDQHQHRLQRLMTLPEAQGRQQAARALAASSLTEDQIKALLPSCAPDDPAHVERVNRSAERDQHLAAGGIGLAIMAGGFLPVGFGLIGKPGAKPVEGGDEAMAPDDVATAINAENAKQRG